MRSKEGIQSKYSQMTRPEVDIRIQQALDLIINENDIYEERQSDSRILQNSRSRII